MKVIDGPGIQMQATSEFDEFFRREQPKLVALAIGLTGVPEAARDLAQDTMVKAYRDWAHVSSLDRPGAWARRVTINAAMSWHRSAKREGIARARLGGERTTDLPVGEGARFWAAVRALPERQRAVVALYYLDDLPIADVADTLQIPAGTVKSTLSAARAALAVALGVGAHQEEE